MIKKLIFMTILGLSSLSMIAQNRINLVRKNTTLKELFSDVQKQYGYSFIYSNNDLNDKQTINIDAKNMSIQEVLNEVFKDKNVSYEVKGNQVVLNVLSQQTQKKKTISGIVLDEKREPAIGVSIVEMGSTNGTITDIDGRFSISVADNAKLNISFIGYKSQIVSIVGKSNLDIFLTEDSELLSEVVVTALGIKREQKALGYATQNLNGENIQTVRGLDMATSLTGRVAGLNIMNSTEFGEAATIKLRGEDPILVIDGVPYANMTLRDVPADDIEQISVLKGATASALYGERGGNGAIMITTKKGGKLGLSISINTGMMLSAGYLAIPEMQSTYGRTVKKNEEGKYEYLRTGDGSWGVPMEGQEVVQWDPISKTMMPMPYLARGKNNFNNFLETGHVLNNNINITQQGKNSSIRASATWAQNKGQYPNSKFDKYTYSLGGEIKIDNFTLSSNMTYNKQSSPNLGFGGYRGYDPMYSMLVWSAPDYDVRDFKDYWLVKNELQNNSYTSGNNNPYFDSYERLHSLTRDILNGTLSMNYKITPWLNATARIGFDTYSDHQEVRVSQGSLTGAGTSTVIKDGTEIWGESLKGSFNTGTGRGYSLNNEFIVSAEHKLNKFTFDGFIGGSIFYRQDDGIEAFTRDGLSIPGFYSLNASVSPAKVNSRLKRQQTNSLLGRLAVSWDNLVFVEGTLRNDWSSTLSQATRSYLYPSVAGSFVVSELLQTNDWFSFWKVRSSWTTSKKATGVYDINSDYKIIPSAWGNLSSANYPNIIRGDEVKPQGSTTFEIGTSANFFENKLSFDIAYYNRLTYDFIKKIDISDASGFNQRFMNSGERISTRGWEITANVTAIKTNDWSWNINLNWSKFASYYNKLDENFSQDKPWIKVGQRTDHLILRDYQRDSDGNIIHNNGQVEYSKYDSNFGYKDPDWIWGIGTNLRYKNFQLNIAMDGRVGGLIPSTTEMYMWRAGSHPNSVVPERYLDATKPGSKNYIGQGVKVISGSATYDTYGNILTDDRKYAPNDIAVTYETYINNIHKGTAWGGSPSPIDVYSATFFKIREVSFTYILPYTISHKIKAKGISISAVGQNLLLWAKDFKYSDPDGGEENFSDPSRRYLGLNLKIDF